VGSFAPVTDVGQSPPPRSKSIIAIFHQFENLQTRLSGDLARENELLNTKLFRDRWVMSVAEAVLYFIPAASRGVPDIRLDLALELRLLILGLAFVSWTRESISLK
jgi:hypothetical protein